MDPIYQFNLEKKRRIEGYAGDLDFQTLSRDWLEASMRRMYVYNFEWMGRPIIQYPQDILGMQELIWTVRPDLIIETGIAHGGSLVFSASMLAQLDLSDAIKEGRVFDPSQSCRKVLGIDVDIRSHNREAIEAHPMACWIEMFEGSSISEEIIAKVHTFAKGYERVLVCLDSMHTHDHVLAELNAYGGLVTVGSYCVVFDSFVEDMPPQFFADRPWDVGNNPKTAVWEYLEMHSEFEIDKNIQNKLLVTVAPDGYLKRMR